jgi:hypothetical protein
VHSCVHTPDIAVQTPSKAADPTISSPHKAPDLTPALCRGSPRRLLPAGVSPQRRSGQGRGWMKRRRVFQIRWEARGARRDWVVMRRVDQAAPQAKAARMRAGERVGRLPMA